MNRRSFLLSIPAAALLMRVVVPVRARGVVTKFEAFDGHVARLHGKEAIDIRCSFCDARGTAAIANDYVSWPEGGEMRFARFAFTAGCARHRHLVGGQVKEFASRDLARWYLVVRFGEHSADAWMAA